ncbi:MAG TPA: GNAT family N-acetyltransferase [Blastocatellia bacterium]|nr:GNAT family N-acetyltransferase [Blastocatellia bacterium]
MTGYLHAAYASAFVEHGEPLLLPASQGWLIRRAIAGTAEADAMGCYPFLACRNWRGLDEDLQALDDDLVSVTVVTDPLGEFEPDDLRRAFPDLVRFYKKHFIADLSQPLRSFVSSHHQRNARQALSHLSVERCPSDSALDEWVQLYQHLIVRHSISGLAAFSRDSFARQLQVPGLVIWRAVEAGRTVGMTLWYQNAERADYHLAAYTPRGYELKASAALFWRAFEEFAAAGVRRVVLGAGAGISNDGSDGLTRFKRGWANETRPVYLCGRIGRRRAYEQLTGRATADESSFFPAYRQPVAAHASASVRS